MASAVFLRLLKRKCLLIKLKIKTNDIVVTVHIITILYKYMYRHMYSHIWQAWAVIPGKEGLEFHVIVWKLTRKFSGQTKTVDIRGLIIIVSLLTIFKYIFICFLTINVYHDLVIRTRQDIIYSTNQIGYKTLYT